MKYAIDDARDMVFRAGQVAPAGRYLRVDSPAGRIVTLEQVDILPATFDGHVAEYVRINDVAAEVSRR